MSDIPADFTPIASSRILIIESLVPLVASEVAAQMGGFIDRLAEAMFRLSDQSVRPNEANLSFNAWNHLKKNATLFQRGALAAVTSALLSEIAALRKPLSAITGLDQRDLSLISLDEMENKVLISSISQAIELKNSSALVAVTIRLSRLLQQPEISVTHNPFRPAVFLRAVFDAWCKFDPLDQTHRLVLRLFRPDVFLNFEPLLAVLNNALIARGILPDLSAVYRHGKVSRQRPVCPDVERRDASLRNKLQRWLQPAGAQVGRDQKRSAAANALRTRSQPSAEAAPASSVTPLLMTYLSDLQRATLQSPLLESAPHSEHVTAILRDIVRDAPAGSLGSEDNNTIELLARVFDFVFADPQLPSGLKKLLGQLQLPLLKTALVDKDFFYEETHPARRLLDQLAQSGIGMHPDIDADDPLYKIIEQLIDRVQHEFDLQLGLYTDIVADLQAFIADQESNAAGAIKAHIDEALHEEKMWQAQQAAENDIAARIETGEVAGFVENFLETQWVHVLTLTHSVAKRKPQALTNALKAMDDLIWSVKPKVSTEERAELMGKLPSMLSLLNAWLNAIKWDEPARVTFFSALVERHAAIVQRPVGLSPRHQLHIAVNVAQKVSERRLNQRARELDAPPIDQFVHLVDSLEIGRWIEFIRHNGAATPFRLVWLSPLRSRFIFCTRQNDEPFSFTADELALALREQGATLMPLESVSTRALSAALDSLDSGV